jgi:hypothetical protein
MNSKDEEDKLVEEYNKPDPSYEVPKEDMTCFRCDDVGTCKYAWDLFNVGGDCLANK